MLSDADVAIKPAAAGVPVLPYGPKLGRFRSLRVTCFQVKTVNFCHISTETSFTVVNATRVCMHASVIASDKTHC